MHFEGRASWHREPGTVVNSVVTMWGNPLWLDPNACFKMEYIAAAGSSTWVDIAERRSEVANLTTNLVRVLLEDSLVAPTARAFCTLVSR
jgi:hypothetical protein